ncbi:MAG: dihydroorotate dehydrogenase electron transfer subunit [Spirochaetes bacterium]|nr:dihydroorotate dehydrogenase electron transfer subunit [Spirochaetota bacterium]
MQVKKRVFPAVITKITDLGSCRIFSFRDKQCASQARAGMFLSVDCGETVMLRRPFAVMEVNGDDVSFLFKIVGKGTAALAARKEGDVISITGPLGMRFPDPVNRNQRAVLVAGGVGTPPIYFLAKELIAAGHEVYIFLGASKKDDLLLVNECKRLTKNVFIATDDGSYGEHGTVLNVLSKNFGLPLMSSAVYACGPVPMLKALGEFTALNKLTAHFSLEAVMGCGYGVCLGCAVQTRAGYKLCCSDGPVFRADDVVFA